MPTIACCLVIASE